MSRLIDIDNLHIEGKPSTSIEFDAGVIYAVECVKSMPTVDAAPVVRCKDCKKYDLKYKNFGICNEYGGVWKEEDFCAHGERKGKHDD